jgi:hypothetical protein
MYSNPYVVNRANQTHQWQPSDSLENYKKYQPNGQLNYSIDAFDYKFNSNGFRCDNFDKHSDLPILFMGCSFTEGTGLPLSEIWPTHILNNIKALPDYNNKQIPFWSIALPGSGLDSQLRELYNYYQLVKPKYIFVLLPQLHRREFCFNDTKNIMQWVPSLICKGLPIDVAKLFMDDSYAYHQSYKNLSLLNLIAEKCNSKVFVFDVMNNWSEEPLHRLFNDFSIINFIKLVNKKPKSQTDLPFFHARDSLHFGAWWQKQLATDIWHIIKSEFETPTIIAGQKPFIKAK